LTVNVPSVDSAYSAESTDGTLTKSATKTVLFQYSKIQNIPISGAGAEPVRPMRCFVTPGKMKQQNIFEGKGSKDYQLTTAKYTELTKRAGPQDEMKSVGKNSRSSQTLHERQSSNKGNHREIWMRDHSSTPEECPSWI